MIESKLTKINVFSSKQQYDENKGQINPGELSLVPYDAVPAGFVISIASNEVPDGYLLCNGGQVSRSTYANLFSKIGTTYGSGDGSTTFNLPNLNNGSFLEGSNTVGTVKSAGLPNITGVVKTASSTSEAGTGAFSDSSVEWSQSWGSASGDNTKVVDFKASNSNSIYGNSDTVQPKSVTVKFCIKY